MQGRLLLLWSEVGYNFRYSWAIKLQSAHWETSACSSHSVRHVSKVWQWSKLKIGTLVCNSVTNSWCFWAEIRQAACQSRFLRVRVPIFCLVSDTPFRNSSNMADMSAVSQCTLAAQMAASGHLISPGNCSRGRGRGELSFTAWSWTLCTPPQRTRPPRRHVMSSAGDDPSVSQSVYTITIKTLC